jgi:glycosyltransferase involved in cell wall biosynthesis
MKTVLFHREFLRFQGGHLKVWQYFNHVRSSPDHRAVVRFTADSIWDETNPWQPVRQEVLPWEEPVNADILFVAGRDWRWLEPAHRAESPVPVINMLQHVLHASPEDPLGRRRFLPNKAIRICTSSEIAKAINATGIVRGPVFAIPAAIDLDEIGLVPRPPARDIDLLVLATKQAPLGRHLAARLEQPGRVLDVVRREVHRSDLLQRMARARVTLYLPNRQEGFYIPALEGMALGTVVVCPDTIGNRSFCRDGHNCFMPEYEDEAIIAAVTRALEEHDGLAALIEGGEETARAHDLMRERATFHELLSRVDELWADA